MNARKVNKDPFKTVIAKEVFKFKQKYYLTALVVRNFNFFRTAKEIGANRGDIVNHVGTKQDAKNLARKLELL